MSTTGASFITDKPAPPIAREGWPILAGFVVVSLGATTAAAWAHPIAGAVVGPAALILTLWAFWFFRDPARRIPADPELILCPADGVICQIAPASPPPELGLTPEQTQGMTRVSVFMNVFNVHVNRAPAAARVRRVEHKPGSFLNAAFEKASEQNERCSLLLELPDRRLLPVVQVAGLVARRIVCRVKPGAVLGRGERFGIIRFGSRVDTYLPAGVAPSVRVGERVIAGETVLASLRVESAQTDRQAQRDPALAGG